MERRILPDCELSASRSFLGRRAAGCGRQAINRPHRTTYKPFELNMRIIRSAYLLALMTAGTVATEVCMLAQAPSRILADINPGPSGSLTQNLTSIDGRRLFFMANDGSGSRLWTSDGSTAGTRAFPTITRSPSGFTTCWTVSGQLTFFRGADALGANVVWRSDGSVPGTFVVASFPNYGLPYWSPVSFRGRLYFISWSTTTGGPIQLWSCDGTLTGTQLVADLGASYSPHSSVDHRAVVFDDRIYFSGPRTSSTGEADIWISDGTPVGTVPFTSGGNYRRGMTVAGGRLYYSGYTTASGAEPWVSDGTVGGTRMLANLKLNQKSSDPSVGYQFTSCGSMVFFVANVADPNASLVFGDNLFVHDSASGRLSQLSSWWDQSPFLGPSHLTCFRGRLYCTAAPGPSYSLGLYATDGTSASTLVTPLPVRAASTRGHLHNPGFGSYMYFAGEGTASSDYVLGRTDGSVAGTVTLGTYRYISPQPGRGFLPCNGRLYFHADDGVFGRELHELISTDGLVEVIGTPCGALQPTLGSTVPLIGSHITLSGSTREGLPGVGALFIGLPSASPALLIPGAEQMCPRWFDFAPLISLGSITTLAWTQQISIAAQPSLLGATFMFQTIWLRSGSTALESSNAVQVTVGS
jgi:ELWxxDGT repeat protein